MNRVAGKLEADRHRDQAGAHDAVIGRDIFGGIGGEDSDPISAREPTPAERAGDAVRHGVEARVADLARERAAKIDDRHFVKILVARDEVAEIGKTRHGSHAPFGGAVR